MVLRASKVVALALVPVLSRDLGSPPLLPYLLLIGLVVVVGVRGDRRRWLLVEGAGALVLTLAAGTFATAFLPYLAVLAVAIGRHHDLPAGVLAGLVLSTAQLAPLFWSGGLVGNPLTVGTTYAFLPLLGATAGMWSRVVGAPTAGRQILEQTNRVLRELVQLSADVPGGLSVSPIGTAAVQDVSDATGAPLVALYEAGADGLELRASQGSRHETLPDHLDSSELPAVRDNELTQLLLSRNHVPHGGLRPLVEVFKRLLIVPVTHDGVHYGAFLVAGEIRGRVGYLREIASDTALALDNARLFQRARDAAADATRDALAHDLHDSVAQALTHLRLELQLLGSTLGDPALADQVDRLARVASRAVADLRATIDVLRTDLVGDDIVDRLATYLHDLDGTNGVRVTFHHDVEGSLDGHVAAQLRFVAQEAVSNALRHSAATRVHVTLTGDAERVCLEVEDDGRGLPTDGRRGPGLGLTAMQRRATRLDAALEVTDRTGGGTLVRLEVRLASKEPRRRRRSRRVKVGGGTA